MNVFQKQYRLRKWHSTICLKCFPHVYSSVFGHIFIHFLFHRAPKCLSHDKSKSLTFFLAAFIALQSEYFCTHITLDNYWMPRLILEKYIISAMKSIHLIVPRSGGLATQKQRRKGFMLIENNYKKPAKTRSAWSGPKNGEYWCSWGYL